MALPFAVTVASLTRRSAGAGLALDKAVAFELCDLAAHRRVVAPDPLGEFDHPNWSASSRAAIRTREVEPLFDERA